MTTEDQGPGSQWWKRREGKLWIDVRSTLGITITCAAARAAAPKEYEVCDQVSGPALAERKALQEKGVPFDDWDGPAIRTQQEALRKLWTAAGDAPDDAIRRLQKWLTTDNGRTAIHELCDLQRKVYDGAAFAEGEEKLHKAIEAVARRIVGKTPKLLAIGDEILRAFPDFLPLGTGHGARTLARTLRSYKPEEIAGRVYKGYEVEILDPEGKVYFHPLLPGMEPDADAGSIQQAIVSVMPDAYALKILDLCAALALLDPTKGGKFWWHDNKATLAFGLAGRKDSTRGGACSMERKRYAERFELLVSTRVRITHKLRGKARQVIEGPLLLKYDGPEGVTRANKTGRRGRPTVEHRYEVNEFLFAEAKRFNVAVPRELFALPPGPVYKLARYCFVRCKMHRKGTPCEDLERVAHYAGLKTVQEVERTLRELKARPVPGLTLELGRRGLSMSYEGDETPALLGERS